VPRRIPNAVDEAILAGEEEPELDHPEQEQEQDRRD
jgi:hypothetical protein